MPFPRSDSIDSLADSTHNVAQLGPFSGPTDTAERRRRLLRIGSGTGGSSTPTIRQLDAVETSSLNQNRQNASYGTLPSRQESPIRRTNIRTRGRLALTGITDIPQVTASQPDSPTSPTSYLRLSQSYFRTQRPISAYDTPLRPAEHAESEEDLNARTNGIRVWYSSFSSIDWLHDAIKDSVRFARLRRGKSLRSKIRLIADKSIGWVIVTLVGFLTAVVAFLVVRAEQWFFDSKEGYCRTDWTKAKRFCCPPATIPRRTRPFSVTLDVETCPSWRTWGEVFGQSDGGIDEYKSQVMQYIAYTIVALLLALVSCLLTINLTASTSFVTRKESGVLSPDFDRQDSKGSSEHAAPKRKTMYYAAGSGIPELKTILSGFVIHGYLGGRVLFTKSFGLALSVASGLSLGKEGPFVHIASCIGNIISRFVTKYENNEGKRREIISAAAAAGVAVAFGAPIGGTLFSLEEVSYFFPPKVMWRSFFCAMIAAITLRFLDPFGTGKLVLFQGVYGAYFSKLNYRWSRHVTLVTTCICFINPYTRMGGTELVYELFAECRTGGPNSNSNICVLDPGNFESTWPIVRAILAAMAVKACLTVVTFGIKVPAGIFIPTLGVGACAGRLLGVAVKCLQWKYPDSQVFAVCKGDMDCVVPGLYAMVGAAAALSGVTTNRDVAVIHADGENTVKSLRDQLQSLLLSGHDDGGFPIVSEHMDTGEKRLTGYIGANELEHALSIVADEAEEEISFHTNYGRREMTSSSVSSFVDGHSGINPFDFTVYMDQAPLTIQSNAPLELVQQFFVKLGARYVVVTDTDGDYEGIIDKKTWLAFLSGLEEKG
ncbi:hypothetical protein HWV62_41252 [Athelia sp. TMB]|nr:hypothetical protein HWV62_41252 [Athelia sp. TMB]